MDVNPSELSDLQLLLWRTFNFPRRIPIMQKSRSGAFMSTCHLGGAENAGHENDGPAKYRVVKMQDMKMRHTGSSHVAVINSRH